MVKTELLNIKGEKVKDIELNENLWNIEPNDAVLHNHIILTMASLRQGTSKVKNRSEVSGGGRKPWRQKGTGRARAGSIRAPHWRGGGVVFGPTPRDYSKKMNKKERRLALISALSYKYRSNELIALDKFEIETPKTKEFTTTLENLKVDGKKVLFITHELNDNVVLGSRNLENVLVLDYTEINTLDIVNAECLIITEEAIKCLEEVYA